MLPIATGTTYQLNDSRVAGLGCFVSLYVLVLGAWTVQLYIRLAELIEKKDAALGYLTEKRCRSAKKKPRSNGSKPLHHGQPCTEKLIPLPAHPSTLNYH
jgi:hypothetical protein